jgi:signal transduction histidine kinase
LRFAKRSSTDASPVFAGALRRLSEPESTAPFLAVASGAGAIAAVVGIALGAVTLSAVGFVLAIGFAGLLAASLIVAERRRHEAAEEELTSEARFLESLVDSLRTIAGSRDVLAETCAHAERLFTARAEMLRPGERPQRPPAENAVLVPVEARGEEISVLRLTRDRPFTRDDLVRATVLADFAAGEYENARLLDEAQVREGERSRLTDQLITAEQDERRRLANELHDGVVQSLSGIALLLDAGIDSIGAGRDDEAREIIGRALERHRATIRQLRDLSFNLEPVVLRDQGFAPAVRALTDQIAIAHGARIDVDADAGERLDEKTQAALYQIIREALNQAVRRGPPHSVVVAVREEVDGSFEARIEDDAPGERRRRSFDELAERARTLHGRLTFEHGDAGGTTVRISLPPYARAD